MIKTLQDKLEIIQQLHNMWRASTESPSPNIWSQNVIKFIPLEVKLDFTKQYMKFRNRSTANVWPQASFALSEMEKNYWFNPTLYALWHRPHPCKYRGQTSLVQTSNWQYHTYMSVLWVFPYTSQVAMYPVHCQRVPVWSLPPQLKLRSCQVLEAYSNSSPRIKSALAPPKPMTQPTNQIILPQWDLQGVPIGIQAWWFPCLPLRLQLDPHLLRLQDRLRQAGRQRTFYVPMGDFSLGIQDDSGCQIPISPSNRSTIHVLLRDLLQGESYDLCRRG